MKQKNSSRLLFLPHCAKMPDCKNVYEEKRGLICQRCDIKNSSVAQDKGEDGNKRCLISRAIEIAEGLAYEVFILPGGSIAPVLVEELQPDIVVAVACENEVKKGLEMARDKFPEIDRKRIFILPLEKDGCVNTFFNVEKLFKLLYQAAFCPEKARQKEAR